jgi:hypothetical protein
MWMGGGRGGTIVDVCALLLNSWATYSLAYISLATAHNGVRGTASLVDGRGGGGICQPI